MTPVLCLLPCLAAHKPHAQSGGMNATNPAQPAPTCAEGRKARVNSHALRGGGGVVTILHIPPLQRHLSLKVGATRSRSPEGGQACGMVGEATSEVR